MNPRQKVNNENLTLLYCHVIAWKPSNVYNFTSDTSKPAERQGRKAMGLRSRVPRDYDCLVAEDEPRLHSSGVKHQVVCPL